MHNRNPEKSQIAGEGGKTRKWRLAWERPAREGQSLKVSAEQLHRDLGGAIYAFFVAGGEIELLAGKALLKLEGNLT